MPVVSFGRSPVEGCVLRVVTDLTKEEALAELKVIDAAILNGNGAAQNKAGIAKALGV